MRRVILDWIPDYDISECGEIRRITEPKKGPGRNKKVPYSLTKFSRSGYPSVRVMLSSGDPSIQSVHRLVCEAFHGKRPSQHHLVAHNDGDKMNSNASNLRWATQAENISDMDDHGTRMRGEAIGNSKLKECDVLAIRRMREAGEIYRNIAEKFGVSIQSVHGICNKKVWAWL